MPSISGDGGQLRLQSQFLGHHHNCQKSAAVFLAHLKRSYLYQNKFGAAFFFFLKKEENLFTDQGRKAGERGWETHSKFIVQPCLVSLATTFKPKG